MPFIYWVFALQTILASVAGAWVLYHWQGLWAVVRNASARRLLKIVTITCCFYAAYQPANFGWHKMTSVRPFILFGGYLYVSVIAVATAVLFNLATQLGVYQKAAVNTKRVITFCLIGATPLLLEMCLAPLIHIRGIYLIENLSFTLWAGCLAAIIYLYFENYTARQAYRLQQKELDLAKLEHLKIQAQLDALQAKINPHFLYNSLSAMAGLALEDGEKTSKMAVALSKLFRYNLNKAANSHATVAEELDMVQTYLTIEKIRFEERLQYHIHADAQTQSSLMPRFVLQPLAENCIKHGFNQQVTTCHIDIRISQTDKALQIVVADNGAPFGDALQPGYGLQGIYQKLALLYPNRHEVRFNNQPKQIEITIFEDAA